MVASAFISCQQERLDPNQKNETEQSELHFVVKALHGAKTRTYLTDNGDGTYTPCWKSTDKLGAFLGSTTITKNTNHVDMTLSNTVADGTTGVFEGTAVASGSGTFHAFYPSDAFEKGYNDGGIGLNIGATTDYIQHPYVHSPDSACNILVSKSCKYSSNGTVVTIEDLEFTRPLSILRINLKGSYAEGEAISWFKMSAPSTTTLSGRVSINLSTAEINSWTSAKNYAWAEYAASKPVINDANDNTVYFVVNPTTISSGTDLTFTAETGNYSIQKKVTLSKDMTFPAAGIAVINLTIVEADCSAKEANGQYGLVEEDNAFEANGQYVFIMPDGATPSTYYALHSYRTLDSGNITPVNEMITNPDDKYVFIAEAGTESGKFALKNKSTGEYYPHPSSTTTAASSNPVDNEMVFLPESGAYRINLGTRFVAYYTSSEVRFYSSGFEDQIASGKALASQKSGAFKVYKLNYTPKTRISTPTGLSVNGMVLSWNAVSGAASYDVKIGDTTFPNIAGTSYTFTGTPDYYNVSVVAIPSDTEHNKKSLAATLSDAKFGTPAIAVPVLADGGTTASSVKVTWTDDPHAANGYHCELFLGVTKEQEKDVALGAKSVTFDNLSENTEYIVKVNGKAVEGAKTYAASAVASINLTTVGTHVEDITEAGSYTVEGLNVMAVNGRSIIASDETGAVLIYGSSNHGFVVNDVINVSGTVKAYNGVWEFDGPDIEKKGTTTVTYPSPVVYNAAKIESYATAPVIEYATATGVADSLAKSVTVAAGKILNVYGKLSAVHGRTVSINGYAFGYNNSKVNFMLVGTPTIDQSVPYLGTNPDNGQTIQWDNDKYGSANAQTITVSLNNAASGYTVSFSDTANAWTVSDNGEGTITVYPKAANTSTTADKTLTLTVAHKDNTSLTSVITLTQKKQSGSTTEIEYNFNVVANYPTNFPTGNGTAATTPTDLTIGGHSLKILAPNAYYRINSNNDSTRALFFGKTSSNSLAAYLEFPGIEGKRITKIVVTTSSSGGGNIAYNVFNTSGTEVSAAQTTSASTEHEFEFTISSPVTAAAYRVSSKTNNKNLQIKKVVVSYE